MKSIRILLFIKVPPPLTGATIVNEYLSNSKLLKEKYQLRVLPVTYKDEIYEKYKYSPKKILKIIRTWCRLCKQVIIFKPRFVYFQVSPLGVAFLRDCIYISLLRILRKQILFHLHGKGIIDVSERSVVMKALYRWAFKGSYVICLSQFLTDDISKVYDGVPYIVNNGIPMLGDSFERVLDKDKTINILFLSNLLYSKGILVFLNSLSFLDSELRKKINVQIVGKEAELSRLMLNDEIAKRGIQDFVYYIGPKYGAEKVKVFKQSDILVYPTLNDVWGLVILEAMQYGLAVIASREGAIPEVVDDGVSGFLVEKNNPEQIASKLQILIKDPELRYNMGLKGYTKFANNYTLDIFEKNIGNVFNSIISKLGQ